MALRYGSKAADTWTAKNRQGAVRAYKKFYSALEPVSVFAPFPPKTVERLTGSLRNGSKPFLTYFGAALQTMVADCNAKPNQEKFSEPFMFLTHNHARHQGMIMMSLFTDIIEKTGVDYKKFLKDLMYKRARHSIDTLRVTYRDWGTLDPLKLNPDFPNATGWVWAKVIVPESFLKLSLKGNSFLVCVFHEITKKLNNQPGMRKIQPRLGSFRV